MEKTLLNLIPGACSPEVHLSQYDKGRAVPFKLAEGKSAYSVPDGSEIVVQATKPSGLGFVVPVTFDGDTATMTITETMSNEYGRFPAELSITNNGNRIGTANFVMNIERSPHPKGTIDGDAESLLPELTLLVERIEAAADSVDADTQIVTEAKAEVLQAKADTLQAKADTLTARDDALQAKADAITAKESAEASARAAAESAQEAEDTLSEYAKVDGYYEEMAVGSAEQLLSTQFVEDSVPYKFRTSGGSKDIGNRDYDEIVGGSIVWNQLAKYDRIDVTYDGVSMTKIGNGSWKVSGEATANGNIMISSIPFVSGHKYLRSGISNGSATTYFFSVAGVAALTNGADIWNCSLSSGSYNLRLDYKSGANIDTVITPQIFDLTQMFGSQVADYIYSLETAQSGKGVAFFKSLFPNDYYPYNAGELLSVEGLQSHDTVGFNQWDEEWELGVFNTTTGVNSYSTTNIRTKNYIPVLPNTQYYFKSPLYIWCLFFDADKNPIPCGVSSPYQTDGKSVALGGTNTSVQRYTTPSNARYMRFYCQTVYGNAYKNDICINLSWSGWRNGEYEPYKKHSYPLDSSLTLRGIPKLNAQNELYFDGDIYSHDGKVDRRMFVRRFTKEDAWTKDSEHEYTFRLLLTTIPATEQPEGGLLKNATTHIYGGYKSLSSAEVGSVEGVYVNLTSALYVTVMSCSTLNQFKTWLDTNMLVLGYPITPTEETAEPYTSPQAVDDFGTEEYISGNVVPVGHNTQYPANLRDKLQHLPNLADNDGYYMISQQNKQMSLEVFRIPKAPTTDGTYTLKATVSGGTPTYIWEAVE